MFINPRWLSGIFFPLCFTFQMASAQDISRNIPNHTKKMVKFGIVTDIQYADAEKKGKRNYRNALDKLEKSVNELNNHELAFVINLGDLIDHDYISYDKPLAILGKLKAPLCHVIGNHDLEVADQYKGEIRKRLNNKKGYFEFEVNNMIFIVLDGSDMSSLAYVKGSGQYNAGLAKSEEIRKRGLNNYFTWNGGLGEKQLKWLGKWLNKADATNKKVVLFCHWPLLPENGTQLWNNREVLSLLNNHPSVVAWIAGHHHAGGYEKNGNIHLLTLKGMVEAVSETSFGIMDVFSDKLIFKGYGDQNDQTLEFF